MESPHLVELYENYKDKGLVVVTVDPFNAPRKVLSQFATDMKFTHPVLLMGETVSREQYHVQFRPATYFINHKGLVVGSRLGFQAGDERVLRQQTEELLKARRREAN